MTLRLLRYGLPYTLHWLPGVLLLAAVGLLDNFRVLLLQPIFDQVLGPDAPEGPITLGLANSPWHIDLRIMIPHFLHIHNAWDVVAFALVRSTLLKGLCDYLGTYLVNYAGFGTITDLRNHLYEATLRRSSSFFHKHPTGTILSTLINDVDRVQTALSSVIGEFLQQFFTFIVGHGVSSFAWADTLAGRWCCLFRSWSPPRARSGTKCAPARAPARTSWRRFRTFCMKR